MYRESYPPGLQVVLDAATWDILPIFHLIQQRGARPMGGDGTGLQPRYRLHGVLPRTRPDVSSATIQRAGRRVSGAVMDS